MGRTGRMHQTLREAIDDCVAEARRQGWDGDGLYEMTPLDCQWVVAQLGRYPSAAEWADEGYAWAGGAAAREEEETR